jgi:hypothetical protein
MSSVGHLPLASAILSECGQADAGTGELEGNILLCSGGARGGSGSQISIWTEFVRGATAQDELI